MKHDLECLLERNNESTEKCATMTEAVEIPKLVTLSAPLDYRQIKVVGKARIFKMFLEQRAKSVEKTFGPTPKSGRLKLAAILDSLRRFLYEKGAQFYCLTIVFRLSLSAFPARFKRIQFVLG